MEIKTQELAVAALIQILGIDNSLLEDIKARGIRVPIEVDMLKDGTMTVADGLHRLSAAVKLGLATVPVIVKEV